MLPIPAFNPGDTVTYPNGNGVINVGAADAGSKMLLYNESPFNINIDFLNGSQSILHAWEARYWTLDGDTRQVEWDINSTLNVTSSPISLVIGELYGATERLEGTYPMGLIRQTNVGNPGGIATTSTNQVINDGNTLQEVIEATLSGHTSSDVIINNDGSYTLKGAGVLAAVGILTHILGNLTVDGNVVATSLTNNIHATSAEKATDSAGHDLVNFTLGGAADHAVLTPIPLGGMYIVDSNGAIHFAFDTGSGNSFLESAGVGSSILIQPNGGTQITVASALTTISNALALLSTLLLNNNTAIQAKDSGGTARNMLSMDATNKTHLQSGAAGAQVTFDDSAGAQVGWFDGGGGGCKNGTFQAPTMQQTGAVANGSTISGIRFKAFTSVPSGISTLTHNFGFVPDVAFFACGQAANSNPGTATNSVYNWLANTCTLNIAAAVNGVLVYIKA